MAAAGATVQLVPRSGRGRNESAPAMFADRPIGPSVNPESSMGDQKNEDKQNPGFTDQEKKRENERAGQNPYDDDQASNPERQKKQDPQFDPSHIQDDPNRETTR
jgi:hypothetical protein